MNNYNFDENTPPREIINAALLQLSEKLKPYGFKFLKSKAKFVKNDKTFTLEIIAQNNRRNVKGSFAEIILHCKILDTKNKTTYWQKTLANSNSKKDQHQWINFYGKENFDKNLNLTYHLITSNLIPYLQRLEDDLENMITEIAENGFCIFHSQPVYDAGYHVPINFLTTYGTNEHLRISFQNYIDKHELNFVKPNFRNALKLLRENKEILNNGEKDYAELVFKKGISLRFDD